MIYLQTKKMTFDEEDNLIEHEIILDISDVDNYSDYSLDIEWDFNTKVKDDSWYSFPLFEYKDNRIIPFDYTKYIYFANTDRRIALASKINELFNPSAEIKIIRQTLKFILDKLKLDYPEFLLYNNKVEELINKIPKEKIK